MDYSKLIVNTLIEAVHYPGGAVPAVKKKKTEVPVATHVDKTRTHVAKFTHSATKQYWTCLKSISRKAVVAAFSEAYKKILENPFDPALDLKIIKPSKTCWRIKIGGWRAIAQRSGDHFTWFWAGDHNAYDKEIEHLLKAGY